MIFHSYVSFTQRVYGLCKGYVRGYVPKKSPVGYQTPPGSYVQVTDLNVFHTGGGYHIVRKAWETTLGGAGRWRHGGYDLLRRFCTAETDLQREKLGLSDHTQCDEDYSLLIKFIQVHCVSVTTCKNT